MSDLSPLSSSSTDPNLSVFSPCKSLSGLIWCEFLSSMTLWRVWLRGVVPWSARALGSSQCHLTPACVKTTQPAPWHSTTKANHRICEKSKLIQHRTSPPRVLVFSGGVRKTEKTLGLKVLLLSVFWGMYPGSPFFYNSKIVYHVLIMIYN